MNVLVMFKELKEIKIAEPEEDPGSVLRKMQVNDYITQDIYTSL